MIFQFKIFYVSIPSSFAQIYFVVLSPMSETVSIINIHISLLTILLLSMFVFNSLNSAIVSDRDKSKLRTLHHDVHLARLVRVI